MVVKAVGAQLRWGGQGEKWPGAILKTNPQALQPQRLFYQGWRAVCVRVCTCVCVCVHPICALPFYFSVLWYWHFPADWKPFSETLLHLMADVIGNKRKWFILYYIFKCSCSAACLQHFIYHRGLIRRWEEASGRYGLCVRVCFLAWEGKCVDFTAVL